MRILENFPIKVTLKQLNGKSCLVNPNCSMNMHVLFPRKRVEQIAASRLHNLMQQIKHKSPEIITNLKNSEVSNESKYIILELGRKLRIIIDQC